MLVSVVIPTYSRPDNIVRAIESVLSQTYNNIEIIVVDDNGDGSEYQIETERTLQSYISSEKVIYIKHNVNKNGSAARNTGFRASKGEYVTFLDDDDEMLPQKIEKQVKALEEAGSNYGMAYCGCQIVKNNKVFRTLDASKSGNLMQEMFLGTWGLGSGSNLLVRRDVIDQIGGYDESFMRHQDVEFTLRLFRACNIVGVNEILLKKINDSKPRRPESRKYLSIEEKFLYAFKDDIDGYPLNISNRIYYLSYFKIAIKALNEPDFPFAYQMLRKATTYKSIAPKDWLRLLKNCLFHTQRR